jgi:hypothetical protein
MSCVTNITSTFEQYGEFCKFGYYLLLLEINHANGSNTKMVECSKD